MISRTRVTDPDLRITRTTFDPRKEASEHSIHYGFYTCPKCDTKARFERKDFASGSHSKISAFHRLRFNYFLHKKSKIEIEEKFLDFYCPGCKLPIRIIYNDIEFAMGVSYFVITQIIEIRN